VDVAVRRLGGHALAWPRLGVGVALALLVGGTALLRSLASWHKATPSYFPDEYLYAELARSLAESARPLVRGADAGFPALLQPMVTAPLWLVDDVALSYHLVQIAGTLAMSLAVLPVYVLARRLGLGTGVALACAAFTIAVPDFLYASRVLAEPFAYPLALAAVGAGTAALAGGRLRTQLVFVALTALVVLARVQFLVLPAAYVAALVAVGLRERALRRTAREQLVPLLAFAVALAASVSRPSIVGQYGAFADVDLDGALGARLATNAFGLAYATGWVLVPGALIALVVTFARPRSREELSFAALAGALGVGLLWEAAAYGDLGRVQERYFFYALPLVALLFALYASRGWPHRRAYLLLTAGVLALVAAEPLTSMTAALEKTQSPFLLAAFRLEQAVGSPGDGALLLAVVVSVLVVAGLACALRPHTGAVVALGLATAFCALSSVGASAFDLESTTRVRDRYLPAERTWIDDRRLENVALLHPFTVQGDTYQQLFWNRSVRSLLLFPRVAPTDAYATERIAVGRDGALLSSGRPIRRPLVVDEYAGRVELQGAVLVATAPTHRLWRPTGTPRLRLVADGYFGNGTLGRAGAFRIWPASPGADLAGRLAFRVRPDFHTALVVRTPRGRRVYSLQPGRTTAIALPVCSRGRWVATFEASKSSWGDGRLVSAHSTVPSFSEDPAACKRRRS
jgi:hypothetical protein